MKTMDINWQITVDDKACVEAILEKQHNTWLVRDRYKRNLAETKPEVTQEEILETNGLHAFNDACTRQPRGQA